MEYRNINEREGEFNARETVNGHKIECSFYGRVYEIHFPQIAFPPTKEGEAKKVYDQNVEISEDAEDARFVFKKVKKFAIEEDDIYDLYKRTEGLALAIK